MFICRECNRKCKNNRSLGLHIKKAHGLSNKQYRLKYNINLCEKCGILLSKNCEGNLCNSHRDRSGKNNPFYGKTHSKESLDKSRNNRSNAAKKNWQNIEYREKVIKGVSKPRRKEFSEEQSKRIIQWYVDNPEQRDIRSKNMKRDWANGVIISNNFSSNSSKKEKKIYNKIKEVFSNATDKHTVRVSNKKWFLPDIYISDLNMVIEYNGNYWHANPKYYNKDDIIHHNIKAEEIWDNDTKRTDDLEDLGYLVNIVWEGGESEKCIIRELEGLDWDSCAI